MGLREKITLAVIVATTQIIRSNCIPQGFSAVSIKSYIYRPIAPDMNRRVKNSLKSMAVANDSKVIRFPGVENPSNANQIGDYSRFQNEFENIIKVKITDVVTKTAPELQNLKREAKKRHKYGMLANHKPNPPRRRTDLEFDSAPQTYCLRRPNFFPDVKYPLSARDMWIPNSWNRLLDAERDRPVNMYVPYWNPLITNKDATSPLKIIIDKLYANNRIGKEKTINLNSTVSVYQKGKKIKSTGNLKHAVSINRKTNTLNSQRPSDTLRISTAGYIDRQEGPTLTNESQLTTTTNINVSRSTADLSPETIRTTLHNTTQCMKPDVSPESVASATSPDPDFSYATTDSPFNYTTSPINNPKQSLSCERELSLTVNNCSSTTISPLLPSCLSTETRVVYESGNRTPSLQSNISKINVLGKLNINKKFTLNSNDSIIRWQTCPKCSDDFIFFDSQTKSIQIKSQRNYCNNNSKSKERNSLLFDDSYSLISNYVPSKPDRNVSVIDSNSIIYDQATFEKAKSKELFQPTLENNEADDDSIAPLDDANTTFRSEYSYDTWGSCTDVPYESSDSYTDHVNDIWSTFVNDSCVICQPISDNSDEACLLFLGANAPTCQGNDADLQVT